MSQSSNDTFPTAMHLSILLGLNSFLLVIDSLINSLKKKSVEFKDTMKIGRTHLMDALPITLGDEFSGYCYSIETARQKIMQASENLHAVALGGTAVGSGANSPTGYRERFCMSPSLPFCFWCRCRWRWAGCRPTADCRRRGASPARRSGSVQFRP